MLVCSSPQLIAAYHVLLRLLEPRHPPYALICFKKIQIFRCLTTLKATRYYNFFPICQRATTLVLPCLSAFTRFHAGSYQIFADVPDSNQSTPIPIGSDHIFILKELLVFFLLSVEDIGVEPMTPCLQSRCSSQLS
jgi:hypothetical protein